MDNSDVMHGITVDANNNNGRKICPLTNSEVTPFGYYWNCLYCDCSNVSPDKVYHFKDDVAKRPFRCDAEKNIVANEINREHEQARVQVVFNESLENARHINLEEFLKYCNDVNKKMIDTAKMYREGLKIPVFCSNEQIFIAALFENSNMIKISVTEDAGHFISYNLKDLKSNPNIAISYYVLPKSLADAVAVNLCLKHNIDAKMRLTYDNPVYLKDRFLNKYMQAVYGLTRQDFNKIQKSHLELSAFINYDNVIYIKQEIDEIVRRHDW